MFIVKIYGGLGNQLFQYFFCSYLENRFGIDTAIDYSSLIGSRGNKYRRTYKGIHYRLNKFNFKRPSFSEAKHFSINIIRKYNIHMLIETFSKLTRGSIIPLYIREQRFDEYKINLKYDYYFEGHWVDYSYFQQVSQNILNELKLVNNISLKNQNYLEAINNSNSISIHFIRGIKVEDPTHMNIYHSSKLEYFLNAYGVMKNLVGNPKFFIFSNNIEWVKTIWPNENSAIFIDNWGPDYEHHYLMQNCKHNIIDNSTFSYTAALINRYNRKIIMAPKIWSKHKPTSYPPEWIIMDN